MIATLRFLIALLLLIWLGAAITLTFYVAGHLFGLANAGDEWVPHSTAAADILGPLLHRMEMTAWIVIPIAIVLHLWIWKIIRPTAGRALFVSIGLLAAAWIGEIYSGHTLAGEMSAIRAELKEELGGYHLAPPDHPQRARFSSLHGRSMIVLLIDLGLGLGSFFCVTQLIGRSPASRRPSESDATPDQA